jgi:hypothetical protein
MLDTLGHYSDFLVCPDMLVRTVRPWPCVMLHEREQSNIEAVPSSLSTATTDPNIYWLCSSLRPCLVFKN